MKKFLKRISALLLAFVLCFALCSCKEIKEMREKQAFHGENGEVIWGGQVYKPLCYESEIPEELEFNISGFGNVTKKDVPVLLAEMLGTDMYYNHNKTLIDADAYYAREDVYDYVADLIKYPTLNEYCVGYEVGLSYQTKFQLLKQRYINAIEEIVYGGNEVPSDYNEDFVVWTDSAEIYKCDEKMVFQSLAYRVEEQENGDMILSRFTGEYDVYMVQYRVPDDKKAIMKELLTLGEDGLIRK